MALVLHSSSIEAAAAVPAADSIATAAGSIATAPRVVAETTLRLIAAAARHDLLGVCGALAAGALASDLSDDGQTALMAACSEPDSSAGGGSAVVLALLMRDGAAVLDARSTSGCTAIMMAARVGSAAMVQTLIEAGAALDLECDNGVTAWAKALGGSHVDTTQALESAGARRPCEADPSSLMHSVPVPRVEGPLSAPRFAAQFRGKMALHLPGLASQWPGCQATGLAPWPTLESEAGGEAGGKAGGEAAENTISETLEARLGTLHTALAHLGALRPFLRLSPDGVETPLRFERTHTVLAQVGDGFRLLPMLPVASYCFRSLPICFRRFYSLLLASARFCSLLLASARFCSLPRLCSPMLAYARADRGPPPPSRLPAFRARLPLPLLRARRRAVHLSHRPRGGELLPIVSGCC